MTDESRPTDDASERDTTEAPILLTDGGKDAKVIGELDDSDEGIGVHGHNTAASGETYGVKGAVDSPDGYGLYTPDDAKIDGTVDAGDEWRVVAEDGTNAGNVVQGHSANVVLDAIGVTVAGGGASGFENALYGHYGTVSGGYDNQIGYYGGDPSSARGATVGGGRKNTAGGEDSTVSGGEENVASGDLSTVGGGFINVSSGQYATVGGGRTNDATDSRTTIAGGADNTASGESATVGGGKNNDAGANYATIAGGGPSDTSSPLATNNVVTDEYGTIGGGGGNQAGNGDSNAINAPYATVGGGKDNTASSHHATVGGGAVNAAESHQTTVGGGYGNTATVTGATVGGGTGNTADGGRATVAGGQDNGALDSDATVAGGQDNTASGSRSAIGGGHNNVATGSDAVVSGGSYNEAGFRAAVPGGSSNTASGDYSFATGLNATAEHDGAFVVADATSSEIKSQAANEARFQVDVATEGELTFADGSPQRTAGPIAKGQINADGSVGSAVNVTSSEWSGSGGNYRISIAGESYHYTNFSTVVTPTSDPLAVRTSSVSGNLLVEFAGGQQAGFSFVTHRL